MGSYEILMKGKRAAVGEIRNWSSGSYIKTATGWKPHEKQYSPKYVERKNNASVKRESDKKHRHTEIARLSGEIEGHKAAISHHSNSASKDDVRQAKYHAIRAQVKQRRLDQHKNILKQRHGVNTETKEPVKTPSPELKTKFELWKSDRQKSKPKTEPIKANEKGTVIAGTHYTKREVDILNSLDDIAARIKSPVVQDLMEKRRQAKPQIPSKDVTEPRAEAHEHAFMELVKRNRSQADKQAGYPMERAKVESLYGVKIPKDKAVEMTKHLKANTWWDLLKAHYIKREGAKGKWKYTYAPTSSKPAHEVTAKVFEKKTGESGEMHRVSVEKVLQNGGRVNLRVLRDYPDLAKKYGQEGRIVAANLIKENVLHKKRVQKRREERLAREANEKLEQEKITQTETSKEEPKKEMDQITQNKAANTASAIEDRLDGKRWTNGDMDRVYINEDKLYELYGLDMSFYNTGNVSSASLNGEHISNSEAKRIMNKLNGKFWFDVTENKYRGKGLDNDAFAEIVKACKDKIKDHPLLTNHSS